MSSADVNEYRAPITCEVTIIASTYAEAIEEFGKHMDALKDGKWRLLWAAASPGYRNGAGQILSWQWEIKGEWR